MKKILKLPEDDEKKEIEFELDYLKSLTIGQRMQMMIQKGNEIKSLLIKNGHRKPFEIIKRK